MNSLLKNYFLDDSLDHMKGEYLQHFHEKKLKFYSSLHLSPEISRVSVHRFLFICYLVHLLGFLFFFVMIAMLLMYYYFVLKFILNLKSIYVNSYYYFNSLINLVSVFNRKH